MARDRVMHVVTILDLTQVVRRVSGPRPARTRASPEERGMVPSFEGVEFNATVVPLTIATSRRCAQAQQHQSHHYSSNTSCDLARAQLEHIASNRAIMRY